MTRYTLPIALSAAAVAALTSVGAASIIPGFDTEHITDPDKNLLIQSTSVVAEGRIGNNSTGGTHELAIGPTRDDPFHTRQFSWTSEVFYDWSFTISPEGNSVFTMDDLVLVSYADGGFTDLFIRSKAVQGTMTVVTDMMLNGMFVADDSFADGNGSGVDVLRISNFDTTNGLTLTGRAMFLFEGPAPSGTDLSFQIKAATVPSPGAMALLVVAGCLGLPGRRRC